MTGPTPTPWSLFGDDMVVSGHDVVCRIPNHPANGQNWAADAAFIVTACNAHADLVKALIDILDASNDPYEIARAALKKIKENS